MSGIDTIKSNLLVRKEELEKRLFQDFKEKVSDDQVQDTGDQALYSEMEDIKISVHNNELEEYRKVLKALEMINNGTYGICTECNNKISERRLLMYPNATRCVACQEALEESRAW